MKNRVTKFTEEQLAERIKDITLQSLNEMDGAIYARIYHASHRAENNIQNGNIQCSVDNLNVNNDDTISKAKHMEPTIQTHWFKNFIGQTFNFFGEDRMGLVANVSFTFEKIERLDPSKTILNGTIIFNDTKINGSRIIINFLKDRVVYKGNKARYTCNLEIDNRAKETWDALLSQLKMSIKTRKHIDV